MRICFLTANYKTDGRGAGELSLREHAEKLASVGYDVEVVALDDPLNPSSLTEIVSRGVKIHLSKSADLRMTLPVTREAMPAFHASIKANVALWNKLIELNLEKQFDIVEAPHEIAQCIVPGAARAIPLVVRLSASSARDASRDRCSLQSFDSRLVHMLERLALVLADVVIAPTEEIAKELSLRLSYPVEEIKVVGTEPSASISNSVVAYDLALERFKSGTRPVLYLNGQERIMADTQALLVSYESMLYNLLYQQSWRFRFRHWATKFRRRPRLLAAKLAVRFGKAMLKVPGVGRTRFQKRLHQWEGRLRQIESSGRPAGK